MFLHIHSSGSIHMYPACVFVWLIVDEKNQWKNPGKKQKFPYDNFSSALLSSSISSYLWRSAHSEEKLIMEVFLCSVALSCAVVALVYAWKILNWVWFRPRNLEKHLRQQGFKGNSYRLFYGDFKEMSIMMKEAKSKPMNLSNDIVPRVLPIYHKAVKNYGMHLFFMQYRLIFDFLNTQFSK